MKIQLILILVILSRCLSFKCSVNNPKCFCIESYEYEFQCPSPEDLKTLIHAKQGSHMQIDCDDINAYSLDYLPDYMAGDDIQLIVRRCPMRTDALTSTMNHFNISRLQSLRLEEVWMTNDSLSLNISGDLFKGLQSLKMLELRYLSTTIEDDFLEFLPDLERLYLEADGIQTVNFVFNRSPKLTVLHLSQNSITEIPDYAFEDLVSLKQLHLWKNKLKRLTKATFFGLSNVTSLELSRNQLEILDENVFSSMGNLRNLSLLANNLSYMSDNLFRNNSRLERLKLGFNPNMVLSDGLFSNLDSLVELSLEGNFLEEIPVVALSSLKNLRSLNLGSNKFKKIPGDKPFGALQKLEWLSLNGNEISEVSVTAFEGAKALKTLLISKNRIKTIQSYAFFYLDNLLQLDISCNEFQLQDQSTLLANRLEILILRNNSVKSFPDQIVLNNFHLRKIDLSYNRISIIDVSELTSSTAGLEIDLSNNNITEVDFHNTYLQAYEDVGPKAKTEVILTDNDFICDCRVYHLTLYAHREIQYDNVKLLLDDVTCSHPEELEGKLITYLRPYQITCEKQDEDYCPYNCTCIYRPYDNTFVVDCSHRRLTACPALCGNYSYSRIELNLDGNLIETGPDETMGYEKVVNLILSHNRLNHFDWVPPNIEILNLDENRMSMLPVKTIKSLKEAVHLQKLSLSNNPWRCDCAAAELQNFLKTRYQKVNIFEVLCKEDSKPLIKKEELCTSWTLILAVAMPLIVFLLLVITYMKYKHYIKVWLFSKNWCMCLVSEEDMDRDKKYDVFVSYAHQDEDFVMKTLLPMLEDGPTPYKTCLHLRDWMPGELITTHIKNSVLNSRRTLVVLSNNFLESSWGRLEFKMAHVTAIKDNCCRVIVVKYGELDESKLDDDLKSYLKTNTYVEWGGPWFWKKLFYALPHRRVNRYQEALKHTNVMLKIDDKFELNAEPVSVPDSTPPVLGLDAAKLMNKALDFVPSESPLINR